MALSCKKIINRRNMISNQIKQFQEKNKTKLDNNNKIALRKEKALISKYARWEAKRVTCDYVKSVRKEKRKIKVIY